MEGGPAESSASGSDQGIKNPLEYLEFKQINERLEDATINRHSKSDKFVTLNSLERIWDRGTLGRFLYLLGQKGSFLHLLVDDVLKTLIKTISILVAIGWKKWDTFGDKFLDSEDSVRKDRNDLKLPYTLEALEGKHGEAFLGRLWAGKFFSEQFTYVPYIIKEGGNMIYSKTRPLPFIKSKTEKLKIGGYGSVTKEVIACRHFRRKFTSS
jgi:hypothetical protein